MRHCNVQRPQNTVKCWCNCSVWGRLRCHTTYHACERLSELATVTSEFFFHSYNMGIYVVYRFMMQYDQSLWSKIYFIVIYSKYLKYGNCNIILNFFGNNILSSVFIFFYVKDIEDWHGIWILTIYFTW